MRLWSLAPDQLDRAALVACWREGLLAQKVLAGGTKGYTKHPQLERFRECADPLDAIGFFLWTLQREATRRGYNFDATRILVAEPSAPVIEVTTGQLEYELEWLGTKTAVRAPEWDVSGPARANETFVEVPGAIASWERV